MKRIIEETNTYLRPCAISDKLREDVFAQCASIHTMNAPYRIGYLFNEGSDGMISRGMYCDRDREIDYTQWDFFFDTTKKKDIRFYKLEEVQ